MSRRTERMAQEAAQQASEAARREEASDAARKLAERSHEVRAERSEPKVEAPEPQQEKPKKVEAETLSEDRLAELRKNNPRNRMAQELVESEEYRKQRGYAEPPKAEEKPAEPAAPEAPVEAAAPEAPPAAPEAPAEPEKPAAPVMVQQVVDGETYEVSQSEIDEAGGPKAWRIAKAAENRLKKANDALAEARKMQAELAAKAPPPAPQVSDQQFIEERMDKIRFGTPAEAAQAQLEILQRANKPVDQNAIIEAATQRIAWEGAIKQFNTEFQDIASNPVLVAAADALDRQLRAKGKVVDWINHYRTIGNQVRSAFGRSSQPAPQTDKTSGTPSPQSEKEARKASITVIPTAAARAEPPKEEPKLSYEESHRAAIAAARKARGQLG